MAVKHVVTFGGGFADDTKFLVTLGFGFAVAVAGIAGPYVVAARQTYIAGANAVETHAAGPAARQTYTAGPVAVEACPGGSSP